MIKVAYTNIESKIKINCLLSYPLTIIQIIQGCLLSMPLYITATEVLSNFINADIMTKGIQTEYHEIKVLDFADDTIIFLRDITCLNKIQKTIWKCKDKMAQS